MEEQPILIVGGGIIGLAIGWELARAGRLVEIFERSEAGHGASWLAGGMLAPNAEIQFEEPELYHLSGESLRRWPSFAALLEQESGLPIDYCTKGTLTVADDRDAARALRRHYDFQKEQGVHVEWLTGAEARELEPFLAPRLVAAVLSQDHQVDSRRVTSALKVAFQQQGGRLHENTPIRALVPDTERPAIVTDSGDRVEGAVVILAAGAWSRLLDGLEEEVRPSVRPVKGQVLNLRMERPFDLRYTVRGANAYLVPKRDGRLIVGATSEEMGFDTEVTAGGLYSLLEGAWDMVPGIYDLPVISTMAGLRPGTRDNAPLLGHSGAPGIVFATGHYRHGILLTPVTAEEVARLVLNGETSAWLEPFSPLRFTSSQPARHTE